MPPVSPTELIVLLLLAASLPARAQLRDTKGLAKQHLDDGLVYYNARKYDQAIDEWRQAYLLDADVPRLLERYGKDFPEHRPPPPRE